MVNVAPRRALAVSMLAFVLACGADAYLRSRALADEDAHARGWWEARQEARARLAGGCAGGCDGTWDGAFVTAGNVHLVAGEGDAAVPVAAWLAAVQRAHQPGSAPSPGVLRLAAVGTTVLWGDQAPGAGNWSAAVNERVAQVEDIRASLAASCGTCAPEARPPSTTWRTPFRLRQAAARVQRAALAPTTPLDPLVALQVQVQNEAWDDLPVESGAVGLAALTLAQQGARGCARLVGLASPSSADVAARLFAQQVCEDSAAEY